MGDTLTIRPFVEADLPRVIETLRAALGETPLLRRSADLWDWKHTVNPFGESIVLVAESGQRIAGVRALMRWDLITPAGDRLRCVRAVDTATHPDFHRQGIFRRLTESALEVARSDGVQLVFNTPNPRSRAGYLTMGWRDVGPIGVMVRPGLRFLSRPAGHALPDPAAVIPGATPADRLTVGDRLPRGLRTRRTDLYLRWRFGSHPTARYFRVDTGGSTAVLRPNRRRGRDEMVVSDVFGSNPRRALAAAARRSKAGYLAAWFSPGTPERRAAIRTGLFPLPRVTALSLVARPLTDLPLDIFDPDTWDLALSDLELL